MTDADIQGTFVWHALRATDTDAVEDFYRRVLGWPARAWSGDPAAPGGMTPKALAVGRAGVSVEAGLSTDPRWLSFVVVADTEATARMAERLGGHIMRPVASLPEGGQYALLADPQSAEFAITTVPPGAARRTAAQFVWHELGTDDPAAAFKFYAALFGWERLGDHGLGAMGAYTLFGRQGRQLGGLYRRPSGASGPPHWLVYVQVADIGQTVRAARAAGGKVMQGPRQVPSGAWVAHLRDPQGAVLAVHQAPAVWSREPVVSTRTRRRLVRGPAGRRSAARRVAVERAHARPSRRAAAKQQAGTSCPRQVARKRTAKPATTRPTVARKASVGQAAGRRGETRKAARPSARHPPGRVAGKAKRPAKRTPRKAAKRQARRRRR